MDGEFQLFLRDRGMTHGTEQVWPFTKKKKKRKKIFARCNYCSDLRLRLTSSTERRDSNYYLSRSRGLWKGRLQQEKVCVYFSIYFKYLCFGASCFEVQQKEHVFLNDYKRREPKDASVALQYFIVLFLRSFFNRALSIFWKMISS